MRSMRATVVVALALAFVALTATAAWAPRVFTEFRPFNVTGCGTGGTFTGAVHVFGFEATDSGLVANVAATGTCDSTSVRDVTEVAVTLSNSSCSNVTIQLGSGSFSGVPLTFAPETFGSVSQREAASLCNVARALENEQWQVAAVQLNNFFAV